MSDETILIEKLSLEKLSTDNKINDLTKFIYSDSFDKIDKVERVYLERQLTLMIELSNILNNRLQLHSADTESINKQGLSLKGQEFRNKMFIKQ